MDKKNLITSNLISSAQILVCVVFYSFFWVFATPITFLILKSKKTSLRLGLQILVYTIIYLFFGFLTFWVLLVPAVTVELAIQTLRNRSLSKNLKWQFGLLALTCLIHLLLYILFDFFNSEELHHQISIWLDHIDTYYENMGLRLGEQTESFKFIKSSVTEVFKYLPAIYFISFILGYFSCFWRTKILFNFKCLDSFFWITLVSFSLGFLNFDILTSGPFDEYFSLIKSYQIVFKNIFLVFCGMYFFQGLSVSLSFMEKLKISRFWQNLWYILIIFNLPMVLVAVGIFDFLFEFRSFKEKK